MTKIALVTGGSRGLGRNTALKLARDNCGIVLTYHTRREDADAVVAEIESAGGRAAALRLDTGDVSQFARFCDEFVGALQKTWQPGTFDYLVNNAGHGVHAPFAETTQEQFDGFMNVHLKGVFFLTQTLLPVIEDNGRIVNLSTGLARFSLPGYAAYGAMKGAAEVLTRYLAAELGARAIAVNAVAPGAAETGFGGGVVRDVPEINQMIAATTAMGRAGQPDAIGEAIASLLTGHSQWITGQRIEVSGGQNL